MFEPITRNIFRWGTLDGESGLMMYSHLLLKDGKAVLIDPIMMPNLIRMVKVLGEPEAIMMTNYPHIRGSPLISRQWNIPLYIPDIKEADEDEDITRMFIDLYKMKGEQYGENTSLPMGIKAHLIHGRHEFALHFENFLVVGDTAYGINGKLHFYPSGMWPDEDGNKARLNADALIPIIRKTGAEGLLSGHKGDIPSGLQDLI